ncbi:DNA-binding protein [Streptococcus suis]|nr:DNA-binding protein [Streptococcus suis]
MKSEAIRFIHKLITLAKQEKRYDQLARGYVYLGIAEENQELIDKGLKILELTEEQHILDSLKSFIKEVQTD